MGVRSKRVGKAEMEKVPSFPPGHTAKDSVGRAWSEDGFVQIREQGISMPEVGFD